MRARPLGYCLAAELGHTHRDSVARPTVARIGRVIQTSKSDLMARGVALNLLQMAKRIARSAKPPNTKICPGRKVSPWIASLLMIREAIGPKSDDTEELSMKAPMSVSKPVDLG